MANWSEYSETCRRMNVSAVTGLELELKWAQEADEEVARLEAIMAREKARFEESVKELKESIKNAKKQAKKEWAGVDVAVKIAESYHGASVTGQQLAEREASLGVQ